MRKVIAACLIAGVAMTAAACGGDDDDEAVAGGASTQEVTAADVSGEWPLRQESVVLRCEEGDQIILTTVDSSDWGLNDAAIDAGYQDASPLVENDDASPTGKAPVDELIAIGEELCAD